jgi:hypothetical protein
LCFRCCRSGCYDVTAEANGFKKKDVVTARRLELNQEARVDFALEVGAVTENA